MQHLTRLDGLKRALWGASAACCIALSACGGGGDGGGGVASDASPDADLQGGLTSTIVPNADAATAQVINQSYTIGGTLTGLASGASVTLLSNNRDALTLGADGAFAFPLPVSRSYNVTVKTQPKGQVCTVGNGMGGTLVADVGSVQVTCSSQTYSLGGSVTGLDAGTVLVIRNNGGEALSIKTDGAFVFRVPLASNSSYAVTVARQPLGQTCTVMNYAGEDVASPISNVDVQCSAKTFKLLVLVQGLASWGRVTLLNNGADPLLVTANGSYSFPTGVVYNGGFDVTVGTQPDGQVCTVTRGTGAGVVSNIPRVVVVCSTVKFSVGGTVSGLTGQLILRNNSGPGLVVTADGSFTFPAKIAYNGSYLVTIYRQPLGQTCTVNNGAGSGIVGAVDSIAVVCSAKSLAVGGTLSGLAAGGQVTLANNGSSALKLTENGRFVFAAPVAYGGSYAVTVVSQPAGQVCTVSSGTGSGVTVTVTRVVVRCAANSSTFTVGGSVSGLATGAQLTLLNNGDDALTVTANGVFTFATPVSINSSYAVTVATQPTGQSCSVINGSGSNVLAPVSQVAVVCITLPLARSQYAYVANFLSNSVSQFALGADGSLSPLSVPSVAAGSKPCQVLSGKGLVYVVNQGEQGSISTVSQYAIRSDGTLTPLAPATVSTQGASACAMAISPDGLHAYVGNQQGQSIAQYTIAAGGQLIPMATPTVVAGGPLALVVDPSGSYLYATGGRVNGSLLNKAVEVFAIGSNGALTRLGTSASLGLFSNGLAMTPNGKYLYATNFLENTVSQFMVNSTGGLLTALNPASVPAVNSPLGVVVDPAGSFVFATNNVGSETKISRYTIGTGGALTLLPALTVTPSLDGLRGMAFDGTGKFLYVSSGTSPTGFVLQFRVGTDGSLVQVGAPVAAGNAAYAITTAYSGVAPD